MREGVGFWGGNLEPLWAGTCDDPAKALVVDGNFLEGSVGGGEGFEEVFGTSLLAKFAVGVVVALLGDRRTFEGVVLLGRFGVFCGGGTLLGAYELTDLRLGVTIGAAFLVWGLVGDAGLELGSGGW